MKRKLTLLICCLTVLTSSLPVYAAEKPQDTVVIQTETSNQASARDEYEMGYYKVVGTGVRFRLSLGLSGSIIATLPMENICFMNEQWVRQLRQMDTHGYIVGVLIHIRLDTLQ